MKILYVGTMGFPMGTAPVQKQKLISKALCEGGCQVTIICRRGIALDKAYPYKGTIDGVKYIYSSLRYDNPKSLAGKAFNKFFGILNETILILFLRSDVLITNNRSFFMAFKYWVLAKIKRNKIIQLLVEDNDAVPMSKSNIGRLENKLFNKYVWKMADGAMPISDLLSLKIKAKNENLPQFKLPVLVDMGAFDAVEECDLGVDGSYFLYCGSPVYLEVIKFIIDGYKESNVNSKLVLVISGPSPEMKKAVSVIEEYGLGSKIKVFSFISEQHLINLYKSALGLIIPLRFNVQDEARFPHKIGEYCASKRAIISTNFGEIKSYFTHNKNSLLLNSYNASELAFFIKRLEDEPELADRLGSESYAVAQESFNYSKYSTKLISFIKNV